MSDIFIFVALVLAYGIGYHTLFLGGPALFSKWFPRGAARMVAYAERRFPRQRGVDAVQLLVATRLGIGAGCLGAAAIMVARILAK
jgi:hypothetical protein